MLECELADILLYVPFSDRYVVSESIRNKLTRDEFFTHCFYNPDFKDEIKKINNLKDENKTVDQGYPMDILDRTNRLGQFELDRARFQRWLKDNGSGVFCISGEAGTGKTTYLHYLEHTTREPKRPSYLWHFLDLQNAVDTTQIFNYTFVHEQFSTLLSKTLAIICQTYVRILFGQTDRLEKKEQFDHLRTDLRDFFAFYKQRVAYLYPVHEVADFYANRIPKYGILTALNKEKYCLTCAETFINCFKEICNSEKSDDEKLRLMLVHLLILLYWKNETSKHIVVFDNLERFIHTHEIFNDQIVRFMTHLRAISDELRIRFETDNNALFQKHFQFIVAMRNTSVRMFTPLHNDDYPEHRIDISEWFPSAEIISRKVSWYKRNIKPVYQENADLLDWMQRIMSDLGRTGNTLRGLRLKLDMLFNYNKRILSDILIKELSEKSNQVLLKIADEYYTNKTLSVNLKKLAFRSIIMRIMINALRREGTLLNILDASKQKATAQVIYMTRILTILSNTAVQDGGHYVAFPQLLRRLYPMHDDTWIWFFEDTNTDERIKLSEILYYMNYHNRRENFWFQLIDIQCNSESLSEIDIKSPEQVRKYLFNENVASQITIQISASGRAFLGYIVHTFEFMSCLSGQTKPLFVLKPSTRDLMTKEADQLDCLQLIKEVASYSYEQIYISAKAVKDGKEERYFLHPDREPIAYANRIINANTGFLINFLQLIVEMTKDRQLYNKIDLISAKIREINTKYKNSESIGIAVEKKT